MASTAPLVATGMLAFMLSITFKNTMVESWLTRAFKSQRSTALLAHSVTCGIVGVILTLWWSA